MSNKKLTVGLVISVVIAIIGLFVPVTRVSEKTGSTSTTNLASMALAGLEVGSGCDQSYTSCTGTAFSHLIGVLGTINKSDQSQTASTSQQYDIAVTNMLTTDRCQAGFATTTAASNFSAATNPTGWLIQSCTASTTAGFATINIMNFTGRNASLINTLNMASSVPVWIYR